MKPYRPDILEFTSEDGKFELKIPFSPKTPVLKWASETYTWPEIENPNPKLVVFDKVNNQVILIGGLGDPGMCVGHLLFLNLNGSERDFVNLAQSIPDIEKLSGKWSQVGNFPWIAAYKLESESLSIWVCKKLKAEINLKTYEVTITKSKKEEEWADAESTYNKGIQ